MSRISTSSFQKGIFIEFKSEPHQIMEFQFVNPGKGSAFVRTKLKNLKSGRVSEFTYKSGEQVEEVAISVQEMQFLYKSEDQLIFMDKFNYEQVNLKIELVGDFYKFIKEGDIYQILVLDGEAVGMRYPKKVRLLVTSAEDAVRGSTVMGAKKMVTLETGVNIAVPLFIKKDDLIAIDPETGVYLERAGKS